MSAQRRESTLFLSPLDAFTFDFAPATETTAQDSSEHLVEDNNSDGQEEQTTVPLRAPPAPMRAPLTLEEVTALSDAAMLVGTRYFSLPQNAPTFEQASTQYVQVLQRQAQALKQDHKERQKRRELKKNKRDRDNDA